jgi:hypothetical protein
MGYRERYRWKERGVGCSVPFYFILFFFLFFFFVLFFTTEAFKPLLTSLYTDFYITHTGII